MEPIRVGQRWKTRSGAVVRITIDRRNDNLPGSARWPWALDNSDMVDENGRADVVGLGNNDLIELIEEKDMGIQPISGDDVFLWPCGTQCTRDEHGAGNMNHMSDDFEVVPFGTARHDEVTQGSLDTSEREAR